MKCVDCEFHDCVVGTHFCNYKGKRRRYILIGIANDWVKGEKIPSRKGLCEIKIIEEVEE